MHHAVDVIDMVKDHHGRDPPVAGKAGQALATGTVDKCFVQLLRGELKVLRFLLCANGHYSPSAGGDSRSEEHTSELQSLMRISYAVFCLKKKRLTQQTITPTAYISS